MITILQFRSEQDGWHEMKCIYQASNLRYNSFQVFNLNSREVDTKLVERSIDQSDVVIWGGFAESGYDAYAGNDEKKKKDMDNIRELSVPLLQKYIKQDKPMIGLCFGHHLMAEAMGVTPKTESSTAETGIATVTINKTGKEDDIFDDIDGHFFAIEAHKASVMEVPEGAVNMASTETCEIQALRYGKNVYGFQFHPELDLVELNFRLDLYPEYKDNSFEFDEDQEITATKTLTNFIRRYHNYNFQDR